MVTLKKNIFYSTILTTANYIFPLLTYPYVSRVLGVDKIGICNFVDSIINYFVLFSMLGVGIVGIREIAKNKNDKECLNKTFNSLFFLNTLSTTIMLVLLIIAINIVPKLNEHKELMYIGAFKLVFNYLLIEWLYKGLEDFKFITNRTVIIRCLYVISVFIFIHDVNDYKLYYLLMALMVVLNSIVNILYSRKFVKYSLSNIYIKPYIRPFIILGLYMLLTSMYTSFNVAYLGFVAGETEVGYYTTATKLYGIILSVFTAFTGVMLPRMSALIAEHNIDEFKNLLKKSVNLLFGFSIPLISFTMIFAKPIILLLSGKGYDGAITPMQIVMPLILIIGYEQILVIQTLMPLKYDKAILINSIVGACIGILLNILLVSKYKSVGSAFVWFISELSVLFTAQYFVWKKIKIKFPFKYFFKNIIDNIPLLALMLLIYLMDQNSIINMFIGCAIMLIYSIVVQYFILKNSIFINLINKVIRRH
jgi:O-antigen/teichoic acid export membrane protein